MTFRYALPLLLALLLLSSCIIATEKRDNPLPTLAAQAQAPTDTQAATQLPSTATATLPRATTTPPPTVPATSTFTPIPSLTPTPSLTPIPTYDPSSTEPTFGILFLGIPCPEPYSGCENMLSQSTPAEPYFIHSDGTNLVKLSASDDFPNNLHRVWQIRYSEDGSQFAYPSFGEEGQVELSVVNVGEALPTYSIPVPPEAVLFDYLPEPNCFAFFLTINEEKTNEEKRLITEKHCEINPASEVLDTTIFSEIVFLQRFQFLLAPTGDKFAGVGVDKDRLLTIYIKQLGAGSTPTRILHLPPCRDGKFNGLGQARWLPNGETLEFAISSLCGDRVFNTFYSIDWKGENLNELLSLQYKFSRKNVWGMRHGDWASNDDKFVFSFQEGLPPSLSGLFVLDLQTGEVKQILSEFYVENLRTWPLTEDE